MKTITLFELQQDAEAIVRDLRRGIALPLTYRGQPPARLEPILPAVEDIAADDPLYMLGEQAGLAGGDTELAGANAHSPMLTSTAPSTVVKATE